MRPFMMRCACSRKSDLRSPRTIHVNSAHARARDKAFAEAPGGLVPVRAACRDGKAERFFVHNLPPSRQGVRITDAVSAQSGFHHPENPDWQHIFFCLFAGPLAEAPDGLETTSAVAIQPGKVDRAPTGTALSARACARQPHLQRMICHREVSFHAVAGRPCVWSCRPCVLPERVCAAAVCPCADRTRLNRRAAWSCRRD